MSDEKPVPLPLNGDEIKEAILYRVNESLNRTCHLIHDVAKTWVKGKITIQLEMDDFGSVTKDNHIVPFEIGTSPPPGEPTHKIETEITLEAMPPNEFRIDTDQPVPVRTIENGKMVTKNLRYTPRKKQKQG